MPLYVPDSWNFSGEDEADFSFGQVGMVIGWSLGGMLFNAIGVRGPGYFGFGLRKIIVFSQVTERDILIQY